MLTVGSLFSGLGAFDLAFERAGFRIAWSCEIDKHARSVLAHHWPDVPCYGDISQLDPADLEPVDVVTFGSPCQDLSVAGKRAGMNGARSGLFYEAARIIRGLRPKPAMVVWENVAGALSSADGLDFAAVLDCLADCGALDLCWRLLDGQYAGVAQRRRRVWLVADFGGERAGSVLLESESLRGHPASRREAREGVAPTLEAGTNRTGGPRPPGTTVDTADSLIVAGADSARQGKGPNTTLDDGALVLMQFDGHSANRIQFETDLANTLDTDGRDGDAIAPAVYPTLSANEGGTLTQIPPIVQSVSLRGRDGGATAELGGEQATALRASQGGGDKPHVLYYTHDYNQDRVYDPSGPAPALTAHDSNRTRSFLTPVAFAQNQREEVRDLNDLAVALNAEPGTHQQTFVGSPMTVRRLTPRECERLQSLPDDWTRWGADGRELADGPRYCLIGNSLIVNEANWIATRIRAALEATP